MKIALGGVKGLPSVSTRVGRSSPPSRYSSVLLPEPLAPTIETYSRWSIERLTPLRMCVIESSRPRKRCTFCARRSGPAAEPLGSRLAYGRVGALVGATDHLHRIVLRGPPRRVDRGDQCDEHGGEERDDVLARVLAHEQPLGFHEAFHLDWQPTQPFDAELAEDQADEGSDQADHQPLEDVDAGDVPAREAEALEDRDVIHAFEHGHDEDVQHAE